MENLDYNKIQEEINSGANVYDIYTKFNLTSEQCYKYLNVEYKKKLRSNTNRYTIKLANAKMIEKNKHVHNEKYNKYSNDIKKYILDGLGFTAITKEIDISNRLLNRIAEDLNLSMELSENNKKYKSSQLIKIAKEKYDKKINDFLLIHKGEFIEDINNGAIVNDLIQKYNICIDFANRIIEYLNINNIIKQNISLWRIKQANINLVKANASNKKHGIIIRKVFTTVTDEMGIEYQNYIQNNGYDGICRDKFHKKFKHSGDIIWNQLRSKFGMLKKHPNGFLPGKDNIMYGKEPSIKAGNGIKGWFLKNGEKIHFRSSLEMLIYIYLQDHNIDFKLSKHIVKYQFEGNTRNYFQDIVMGDTICEIKPNIKISWKQNIAKFEALTKYCKKFKLNCMYITEDTYDITYITLDYIMDLIDKKTIIMQSENEILRLRKYYK